jgi:hypothetical protein
MTEREKTEILKEESSTFYNIKYYIHMNINEFIAKFSTHPVLFIGTGISLRYYENAFSWYDLLRQIMIDLTGNEEDFLNIVSHEDGNLPAVSSQIEIKFNEALEHDRNGKFKSVNDRFFEAMRNKQNLSRFKIYITDLVRQHNIRPEMETEIKAFKTIRKNISSIITTNYDTIAENIFGFNPLVGNNILLSNPYGCVYKIHGSIEDPSSLIITSKDYDKFNTKYELIRAQLLSLFIHNPIIFLGYSLNDNNIQALLQTIFAYVSPDSPDAEKVRNNFLVVEYSKGDVNTDVTEYDAVINQETSVKVNKIKTDDFISIYNALSDLNLPISAMDIRKVQNIIGEITAGENGIKVEITEDIDNLENNDKVLVIGSQKTIKYEFSTSNELIRDYFDVMDERNIHRISVIDKYNISKSQFFPIYGFLSLKPDLRKGSKLQGIENQKIKNLKDGIQRLKATSHTTIHEILEDDNIPISSKDAAIVYAALNNQLNIDDIETHLRNYTNKQDTKFRRLLVVYDYMKYSSTVNAKKS